MLSRQTVRSDNFQGGFFRSNNPDNVSYYLPRDGLAWRVRATRAVCGGPARRGLRREYPPGNRTPHGPGGVCRRDLHDAGAPGDPRPRLFVVGRPDTGTGRQTEAVLHPATRRAARAGALLGGGPRDGPRHRAETERAVTPPRAALWLLERLLDPDSAEAVTGDLLEEFQSVAAHRGRLAARQWLWRHALLSIASRRCARWRAPAAAARAFGGSR